MYIDCVTCPQMFKVSFATLECVDGGKVFWREFEAPNVEILCNSIGLDALWNADNVAFDRPTNQNLLCWFCLLQILIFFKKTNKPNKTSKPEQEFCWVFSRCREWHRSTTMVQLLDDHDQANHEDPVYYYCIYYSMISKLLNNKIILFFFLTRHYYDKNITEWMKRMKNKRIIRYSGAYAVIAIFSRLQKSIIPRACKYGWRWKKNNNLN